MILTRGKTPLENKFRGRISAWFAADFAQGTTGDGEGGQRQIAGGEKKGRGKKRPSR